MQELETRFYSEEEKRLLKSTFNEKTIIELRQALFGEVENKYSPEAINILKKIFIPTHSTRGPLFDNQDFFQNVEPLGFPLDILSIVMKANIRAKDLIENAFNRLEGKQAGETPEMLLNQKLILSTDDKHNAQVIYDRATLNRTIETGLSNLYALSRVEDVEEKKKRIAKDSTK